MERKSQLEQPVAGGWLAYCAQARDTLSADDAPSNNRDDYKRNLTEGRSLAKRD